MGKTTTARPQRREAWGRLRKLSPKRWQARHTGPDDKTYSARTEGDKPLTFLTKGDAREWLNGCTRRSVGGSGPRLTRLSDGVGPLLRPQRCAAFYQKATMARDIDLAARMSATVGEEIWREMERVTSEGDRAA